MMEITIQVPDAVGQKLLPFKDRITEVLERGLREMTAESVVTFADENVIIELLASQPTPEQVLALRPSAQYQARVSDLLSKSKQGLASQEEETELERYFTLEHLVRLAKAHAYRHLKAQ